MNHTSLNIANKIIKKIHFLIILVFLFVNGFIYAQTASSNRFKRIDYEYDLISGKVNKVMYQKDSIDQFVHQYDYDSDNRITKVETSSDNVTWDVEAKYFYYAHGSLARTEYGDINNQVQGVDYAYTLQGWLKGINSNTLDKTRDMGQDGLVNEVYDPTHPQLHSNIAKDAFGYSLNYHKDDYKAIGYLRWSSVANRFEASTTNSDLMNSRNDLYNGNISSMVTTIVKSTITTGNTYDFTLLPQGAAYKYDQLNRLVEMKAWQNLNSVNNTWGTGLAYNGLYNNKFSFDANGNILTQLRKDETGVAINDLSYRRFNLASKTMQNRLYMVDDATSNTAFTDDIDDQGTFDNSTYANVKTNNNYGYDEIGNMNRNNQKQIAEIKYTVYGKVKEVIRTSGSTKKNLKFDYDASGNRIAKHVYSNSNVWEKSEYYVVDAQGNVMSVYKHEATGTNPPISFAQIERNIYGSTRIGSDKTNKELIAAYPSSGNLNHVLGNKQYDGVNHLGNVLVTFTNKRLPIDADNNNIIDEYWPEVVSSNDYYPFGVKMKNRSFSSSNNRYQFNNKQYDEETETSDFGARNLDEDLAVWETIDPKFGKFPFQSPYNYANNNPILYIDDDGRVFKLFGTKSGINKFTSYLEKQFSGNIQVKVVDNILTLHRPGDDKPIDINSKEGKAVYDAMSSGQKKLFDVVQKVVDEKKDINYASLPKGGSINGSYNVSNKETGVIAQVIDVDDMEKLEKITGGKVSGKGSLGHEIDEGFIGQTKPTTSYQDAHKQASATQASIEGVDQMSEMQVGDRLIINKTSGDKTNTIIVQLNKDQTAPELLYKDTEKTKEAPK